MKFNYTGIFFGLLLMVGLFTPWMSKGYDPYGGVNLETGKPEIKYHTVYSLSPIYAEKTIDGDTVEKAWLVTRGLLFSTLFLIISSILFSIKLTRIYHNFISFIFAFSGISIFFLSIGRGQAIGVITQLEWGFYITISSVFLMFISLVYKLLNQSGI